MPSGRPVTGFVDLKSRVPEPPDSSFDVPTKFLSRPVVSTYVANPADRLFQPAEKAERVERPAGTILLFGAFGDLLGYPVPMIQGWFRLTQ